MTGSGIFVADSENGGHESGSAISSLNSKTGLRIYQVLCQLQGMSHLLTEQDLMLQLGYF